MTKAESYSLDGLVITSAVPFPFIELQGLFRARPVDYIAPRIVPLDRTVAERLFIPLKQLTAYVVQSGNTVNLDMWQYLWSLTADVYGNTGRPNNRPWINMTEQTLTEGHILPRFKKIFYRPEKVSGIESKGAAIAELIRLYGPRNVTHYDNNPWVIFGLARVRAFRRVNFILVQPLNSGILFSDDEIKKFHNIKRVAYLEYVDS